MGHCKLIEHNTKIHARTIHIAHAHKIGFNDLYPKFDQRARLGTAVCNVFAIIIIIIFEIHANNRCTRGSNRTHMKYSI